MFCRFLGNISLNSWFRNIESEFKNLSAYPGNTLHWIFVCNPFIELNLFFRNSRSPSIIFTFPFQINIGFFLCRLITASGLIIIRLSCQLPKSYFIKIENNRSHFLIWKFLEVLLRISSCFLRKMILRRSCVWILKKPKQNDKKDLIM